MNYVYLLVFVYLLIVVFVAYALLCADADINKNSFLGKLHFFVIEGFWKSIKFVSKNSFLLTHITFSDDCLRASAVAGSQLRPIKLLITVATNPIRFYRFVRSYSECRVLMQRN